MCDPTFALDVVQHSETRLYHSWSSENGNFQLLLLYDRAYVVKRSEGVVNGIQPIKTPSVLEALETQQKLTQQHLQDLETLFDSPSEPEEVSPPPMTTSYNALALYGNQKSLGASVLAETDQEPVYERTLPLVEQALEMAQEQQQTLLEQAEQLQEHIQNRQKQLQKQLRQVPALTQELELLNEKLENWQRQMESQHHHQESLVHHTHQELMGIQEQLQDMLSEGMALQNHLRSRRLPTDHQLQRKLSYLEEMVDHVVAQRHGVHHVLQQRAYQHLETARLDILLERHQKIAAAREALSSQIERLETVNREIMAQDPLAVPEPVPMMVIHELQRLQFEEDILAADAALKQQLKARTDTP